MRIMNSIKKFSKALIITLMIGANVIGPVVSTAMAAEEITYGVVNLTGQVPSIFRLDVRGVPGDIDLAGGDGTNGTVVLNRVLGIFHIKLNIDMASFTLSTTNASGTFETGAAAAYPFSAAMTLNVGNGCTLLNPATLVTAGAAAGQLAVGSADLKVAGAQPSVALQGKEEDCQLRGSWTNVTNILPLAGIYCRIL